MCVCLIMVVSYCSLCLCPALRKKEERPDSFTFIFFLPFMRVPLMSALVSSYELYIAFKQQIR